jgi:hypothetical protein
VALTLGVAAINTNVCLNDPTIREYDLTAYLTDEISIPSENGYFFMTPKAPVTPAALNNILNTGTPVTAATTWSNPYPMLKACFSLLTNQRLYITQSVYTALYAQMVKDGYYIYALRKLLI